MVYIVHNKVPGRTRYKVLGLYGSCPVKELLEKRLPQHKGILKVSASSRTSNVLVYYDSHFDSHSVAGLIERILYQPGDKFLKTCQPVPRIETDSLCCDQTIQAEGTESTLQVKDKIKQLLLRSKKQKSEAWNLFDPDEVISRLETNRNSGLSREIAQRRLKKYGPNILPESKPRSDWKIFIEQFKSLPVYLLGVAAGLSIFTGGILDALVISGVVVVNAFIGYTTEKESEKTIHSLKNRVSHLTEVIREGTVTLLPAEDVVPGDLLVLKPGCAIPADGRVVDALDLSIDESTLTGECMPVAKTSEAISGHNIPLAEQVNMVFMRTLVTGGQGLAVVVATGKYTEIGQLQILLAETIAPETPIERQLRQLSNELVLIGGAVCILVFLIGIIRGYGLLHMIRLSISLAAAAVPEGLTAASTTTFVLGIKSMKRHHVLIRQLQAVEALGAVQIVCFDKTGTITWNRMSVLKIYTDSKYINIREGKFLYDDQIIDPLSIDELRQLIHVCALCNETQVKKNGHNEEYVLNGSPTENSLVYLALQAGIDIINLRKRNTLLRINHRTENHPFMSTLYKTNNGDKILAFKGRPSEVLALCDWQLKDGQRIKLTGETRKEIYSHNKFLANQALRVLGVAYKDTVHDKTVDEHQGLTWLGLVGMADPIREEVKDLVKLFHQAGIETVMITGDQKQTARAVATQLQLNREQPPEIMDSRKLVSYDPDELASLAPKIHIYSRVSPTHKLKIVQALQSCKKIVAMTGDGINDSPALKAADIGIAMGDGGTEIARDVADVVLEKDNLETLIIAVRDGRTTYNNVKKSVHFFLSTNLSEIMVMFTAIAAGIGSPLNAMQLLWINIISDIFPGIALSMEAPEPDVLEKPPRDPHSPLFSSKDFKRMAFESLVITGGALGAYGYGIHKYGMGSKAATLAFQSLTISQLLHALTCRSDKKTLFNPRAIPKNPFLTIALGGSLFFQMLTMFVPGFRRLLGITTLNWLDMMVIGGSTLFSLTVNEMTKRKQIILKLDGNKRGYDEVIYPSENTMKSETPELKKETPELEYVGSPVA